MLKFIFCVFSCLLWLFSSLVHSQATTPEAAIFSLISGSYTGNQTTTLSCATSGAVIRYTTDGSDVSTSSTLYSGAIAVTRSMTIKAKAYLGSTGGVQSSGTYTIEPVQPAIFSLVSGTYTDPQTVRLDSATSNAVIRYTTNGTDVSASSTLYSGPITIPGSMTIKAKAFQGNNSSVQSSGTYTIQPQAAVFSLISGRYTGDQTTTLSCATSGAVIRYTTDGSDVSTSSTLYSGAIAVTRSMTIKAQAYLGSTGGVQSSGTYTIEPVQPAIFSLVSGTYTDPQTVRLDSATSNAVIRYTTNGTDVSASSTLYSGPITIPGSMTIKAKAFQGNNSSVQSSGTYTIQPQAAVFSLISGRYTGDQTTTLSCATSGAVIRYTTDGSDVSTSSTLYSGAIAVTRSMTIKAKAYLGSTGGVQSSGTYTIEPVQPAIFSLVSGTYTDPQTVRLDSATSNAVIRYTTNGTDVSASSTLYSGPITIPGSMTIKAKAFQGNNSSVQSSGTYTIQPQAAVFSLISGRYKGRQTTTLSCATSGAVIRYTTDGSDVSTSSMLYSGPISIASSMTIKAKAYLFGTEGIASSGTYVIDPDLFTVTATGSGTNGAITPSKRDVGSGATATFEVTPAAGYQIIKIEGCGASSTISPFVTPPISADCQVSATFSPLPSVVVPVFSPNGGTHNGAVPVCLSTTTSGAEIRYSIDGSDVTKTSPLYADCFPLEGSATVKAKAFKTGMTGSAQSSAVFSITPLKGPVTKYGYDARGRLIHIDDDKGVSATYALDIAGNRMVVQDQSAPPLSPEITMLTFSPDKVTKATEVTINWKAKNATACSLKLNRGNGEPEVINGSSSGNIKAIIFSQTGVILTCVYRDQKKTSAKVIKGPRL